MFKNKELKNEILPVNMPKIEDYHVLEIAKTDGRKAANKAFDQWENDFKKALDQNDENFNRALKLIKRCEFFYGMSHMFHNQNILSNNRPHYSWCPYSHWRKDYFSQEFDKNNKI